MANEKTHVTPRTKRPKHAAAVEAEVLATIELRRLQREADVARKEARLTSQDFPLLPISETDALPSLPSETDDELTPAQRLAVAAVVAGQTYITAARAAGVTRRTVYAWRQQPAFERAVDRLSRDALDAAAVRVRNLMLRATRVLADSMLGPQAFDGAIRIANSTRLWAAFNAGAERLDRKLAGDDAATQS